MLLAVCACAEGISCCSCAAAHPQTYLISGRRRTALTICCVLLTPPPLSLPLPLPLPLAQAIKLVVKVLSKTMDSTTLSPDKVELATLSRDEDAGQVRAHQLASPGLAGS